MPCKEYVCGLLAIPLEERCLSLTGRGMLSVDVMSLADALPTNWRHHLRQLLAPHACTINMFLQAEAEMCAGVAGVLPAAPLVFNAFGWSSFEDTCVVIVGDPYVSPHWAHGLALSVPADGLPLPPVLQAVLSEVARSFGRQREGTLTDWASQGVLLLNASLTCREGCKATAHLVVWEPFIDRLIRYVSANLPPAVFLLWGQAARAKGELVDRERHLVLEGPHPAACRARFVGCNHFATANNFLVSRGRPPVRWA